MALDKADTPNPKGAGGRKNRHHPGSRSGISVILGISALLLLLGISQVYGEELSAGDWSDMGNAQAKRGEYEKAVASYDRAIELDKYNPDLWYNKGLALIGLGRYEDALSCYQRATKIKPFDADLWLSRGAALSALGRHEEALESYDRAVEFGSEKADVWNNRGTILANLGRYEEALGSYDRAVEIEPKEADAWNNRGTILADLGRYEEALESYDRVVEIEPEEADAWNNRGSALHRMGRYQEAQECYNRAISLDPLHEYAWHNKGLLVPTLDEDTKSDFALTRERIYDEADSEASAFPEGDEALEEERLSGWRFPLVIAAILTAGLLLDPGGKGKAVWLNSILPSLNKLLLLRDRSLKRR